MITVSLLILASLICVWLSGFIYANDFSVPEKSIDDICSSLKKVLIVFPHADDESFSCSGFISELSKKEIEVYWLILTKGEKGNDEASYDEKLKDIRVNESKYAAKIYDVQNVIQKDYPDNSVAEHKNKLKDDIKQVLLDVKPDLALTFDRAGLYGHPDHIVTSEVTTELIQSNFPQIKLWYVSFPKRILDTMRLPEYMAKDPEYKKRRVYPTCRVWVGIDGVVKRIKAVYGYQSQKASIIRGFPSPIVPLWFYLSLTPYEYFHT